MSHRIDIDEIADTLQYIWECHCGPFQAGEGTLEVRLQVMPDGSHEVRYGAPDYDANHSGAWGATTLDLTDSLSLEDATWLARDLASQAIEAMTDHPDFTDVDFFYPT